MLTKLLLCICLLLHAANVSADPSIYDVRPDLKKIKPTPFFIGNKKFITSINYPYRLESLPIVNDPNAHITVRAWRYSYATRCPIEMDNALNGSNTAVFVIHPNPSDDGSGVHTLEQLCMPEIDSLWHQHLKQIINPFLNKIRNSVSLILYSLPGPEDQARKKIYRSIDNTPIEPKEKGVQEFEKLVEPLIKEDYRKNEVILVDDFENCMHKLSNFAKNDAFFCFYLLSDYLKYDQNRDIVIYDGDGYEKVKNYLKNKGITNILFLGYSLDGCCKNSTFNYERLSKDFNLFIVGDATLATWPAQETPANATTVELCKVSVNHLITETKKIHIKNKHK